MDSKFDYMVVLTLKNHIYYIYLRVFLITKSNFINKYDICNCAIRLIKNPTKRTLSLQNLNPTHIFVPFPS